MRIAFVASMAAVLVDACASSPPTPPAVQVQQSGSRGEAIATSRHQLTATVVAVDAARRSLTLQAEDGHIETIEIPAEVKKFEEVSVGDTVDVEVQEGLLFEFQPIGSKHVSPTEEFATARAGRSGLRAAGPGSPVRSTVTVTGVDQRYRIVRFQDPYGNRYQVEAGPNILLEKLARGDKFVATYTTSLAITLDRRPKP